MKMKILIFSIMLVFLTGCMYPNQNRVENQTSNDVELEMVQQAIDQYVEDKSGLVPIVTKDNDTPIYQKYIIDFSKLKQENYIQNTPSSAFENGGVYQYVLITPEEDPTVRVLDLRVTEELRSTQHRVNIYREENTYPPFGEKVTSKLYTLDYSKINLDHEVYVKSPYSTNNLPILVDVEGNLVIDYRLDLYEALQSFDHNYQEGDNILPILTDNYPFVPAYTVTYTVEDGEPVFSSEFQ
ncbi:DUF3939 domain-containing protein [Saliterribacillus persicus]|uniref:Uncharacterized protein DUF3939 n=1 Tax=Saliterribacillus persicus TaxID=930114 RepID=A0A368XEL2_9BACI|nr:DUF3939 domain-containing protein [Saliterribacillus persicus]RCW64907.1 uncharacterized protein DUF3939 [Saliterribacillus persicus]